MNASGGNIDTIDLADVARSLARGWRWIVAGVVLGLLAALLVLTLVRPRFDGAASAIIRANNDGGSSILSKLTDGGAAALLGSGASSPIETDIQILSSRAVIGAAADSLLLQAEVRSPRAPATALLRSVRLPGAFEPLDVSFIATAANEYRYEADGRSGSVSAGGSVALPIGTLQLASHLPQRFTLRLSDREDAIRQTARDVNVSKAGGEVVRVAFRARDSITAAAVPNTILVYYLARRKTDDRGANAHRAEFLVIQIDSTAALQHAAEDALRRFQERSGLVDAVVIGRLQLESVAELQKSLSSLEVEEGALDQLLAQVREGRMTARQLVAYPSFLRSPGINDLLRQLAELETERTKLLERRLESDDQVMALTRSIANIEGQLVPLAKAYAGALHNQRADLTSQIGAVRSTLTAFPGAAQTSAGLIREVFRLNQLTLALQAQLVQARLAAVSEGGDVRALDRATPPKEPAFPRPLLTTALGLGAGLVIGLACALVAGTHGRYLEGPAAIERALGVPAIRYTAGAPLLMSGGEGPRTLLLVPVDARVSTELIAERLANTALARGATAVVLDLTSDASVVARASATAAIAQAEASSAFVVVRLKGLSSEMTVAVLSATRPVLLVAPSGRVRRKALATAVATLRRLEVPCAGFVLTDSAPLLASA